MEDPNQDAAPKEAAVAQSVVICRTCGKIGDHWTRFCPYKGLSGGKEAEVDRDDIFEEDEDPRRGLKSSGGGYIAPALRKGADAGKGGLAGAFEVRKEERYDLRFFLFKIKSCYQD
jgi:hypothetical protein